MTPSAPLGAPRARALALALVGAGAALAACDKHGAQDITGVATGARVKFFNFGVNAPGVNFYANDTKVTAISSTSCTPPPATAADSTRCFASGIESTTGTATGAAAAGGFYVGVAPGQYTFTGRIAAATDNGVSITSVAAPVADGKNYSMFVSGIYNATTKQADGFLVEDSYTDKIAYDSVYLRFVNAIPNSTPLVLYARNSTTGAESQLTPAVAYKSASNFLVFPLTQGLLIAGDLVVRAQGASAVAFTRTAVTFGAGRVYTIAARGDITVTSTTSASRPQLDITANR